MKVLLSPCFLIEVIVISVLHNRVIPSVALLLLFSLASCHPKGSQEETIRVGVVPNLTHAPAFVGLAQGRFQKRLGGEVPVDLKLFWAGPPMIEAILSQELDLAYVGPGPMLNGYFRSKGEAFHAIAGVTSGGAAFIVAKGVPFRTSLDLQGKRLATPQIGNTQDIALRSWLADLGLKAKEVGGSVSVVPVQNPLQLPLFLRGEIDGIWTVEPWVSRLVSKGGGEILFDESSLWEGGRYLTVALIASQDLLERHPEWIERWLMAHVETINWMRSHPEEAQEIARSEIYRLSDLDLEPEVFAQGWKRLEFTYDPLRATLKEMARRALKIGYLQGSLEELKDLWALSFLDRAIEKIS